MNYLKEKVLLRDCCEVYCSLCDLSMTYPDEYDKITRTGIIRLEHLPPFGSLI